MVKLSEFIGEVVSDIADARKIADSNSAALSQLYHADPFLKGMTVPHYTIQEAEIKVPVFVDKAVSNKQNNDFLITLILSTIKLKLPQMLTNKLMDCFIRKREKKLYDRELEKAADASSDLQVSDIKMPLKNLGKDTKNYLRRTYADKSNKITDRLAENMKEYLRSVNLDIIKPLDIRDKQNEILTRIITEEFEVLSEKKSPVSADDLPSLVAEIGTEMFFEFTQKSESNKGIFIDPSTGKINEYVAKDNLMFLTLKVKEQDLDVIIEDGGAAGTQRFLSLN